jgi:hypothetical protein
MPRGIEALGRRIDSPYPAKLLGDALAYEARVGRVQRVSRGRYRVRQRFGRPIMVR